MRRRRGPRANKSFWQLIGVALLTAGITILVAWVAADGLIVKSELTHADALVVLGGSSTYVERTRHAAQLLREGRAPLIILTNDNQISGWSSEEERNPLFVEQAVAELRRLGVPREKIEIVPGFVTNTHDEVVRVHQYAREKKLKSILVVTSAYQTRRALWTLRRVFDGSGIEVGLYGVEPGEQSPGRASWWLSRLGWQMVPGEYLKLVYYRLKY